MHFRRWLVAAGVGVCALVVRPPDTAAQSIAVDRNADGSSCYMPVIPTLGTGTAYIYARLGGAASGGITGAEFRVTGMPTEMFLSVAPNPGANLTLGQPFGAGCNIAFPVCQTGSGGIVLLYTVNLFVPATGVPPYVLEVQRHLTPSNPNFQCPLVTLCDAPVFTKVCVFGGRSAPGPLLQVPSNPVPADGATDVATASDLAWELTTGLSFCCGIGTNFTNVHFGTTPTPPLVIQYYSGEQTYDPGNLAPQTTYYWRIVTTPDADCGTASGPVWSFTTDGQVGVEARTWHAVKAMFR